MKNVHGPSFCTHSRKRIAGVTIHDDVGAGGTRNLMDFCLLLAAVGTMANQSPPLKSTVASVSMRGASFDEVDFARLLHGHVHPATMVGPLDSGDVTRILRRRPATAGVTGDFAGHSLRRGFITNAAKKKIPIENIKRVTGQRSSGIALDYVAAATLDDDPPLLESSD